MKTLLLALEFPPAVGGVETYYGQLVNNWPEKIKIITNAQNQLLSPFLPVFAWLKGLRTVWVALGRYQPDWVLAGEILPLGTIAYSLSFLRKYQYGLILHGLDFSLATKTTLKRWLACLIIGRAHQVICANSATAAEVKKLVPAARVTVVNPGVTVEAVQTVSTEDVDKLRTSYHVEKDFILTTVGRLVPRKGVDRVLEALPEISKIIPNCHYVIIGQGPYRATLEKLVQERKLEKQVTFLGEVDEETKQRWLVASDLFIMPSRMIEGDYEGFGMVYLEAGLHKKPVIAGRGGGVGDAVLDNVTGLMIDGNDIQEIAQAVIKLYQDTDLRTRLGQAGYERALSLTWSQQINKLYSALHSSL